MIASGPVPVRETGSREPEEIRVLHPFGATVRLMKTCHHCGTDAEFPFECQYCGGVYCPEHRLPEGHDCDGVEFLTAAGKRFESKFSDEVVTANDSIRSPEPITPEDSVGDTPDPQYASSPEVRLKDERRDDRDRGLIHRLKRLLGLT